MADVSGLIVWSTAGATVGLIVEDGVVTDAPPYARRWAMGRSAYDIWRIGKQRGVSLTWIERGAPCPTMV
jgi:hypothetical protein